MKKLYILYFVVLFCILGTYIAFMTPDNALRMHISTASQFSRTHTNTMMVWARDLDNGAKFEGYTLAAKWVADDLKTTITPKVVTRELKDNGVSDLKFPALPNEAAVLHNIAALEVDLIDPKGEVQKSAYMPVSQLLNPQKANIQIVAQPAGDALFEASAPAAFMFDTPNDVWITAFDASGPYRGSVKIEQIHGPKVTHPESIRVNGIGHLAMSIQSTSDFKFTAGTHEFYATFVPNEKPLHAAINDPFVMATTEQPTKPFNGGPKLRITPVGSMPWITIDYFQDNAWIDRQTFSPKEATQPIHLLQNYQFTQKPEILYARVGTTTMGTADSTQMFAMITSDKSMTIMEQMQFALNELEKVGNQSLPYLKQLPNGSIDLPTAELIRDYALNALAASFEPDIQVRVKTEDDESKAFEQRKSHQKSICNILLVIWFGLGFIWGVGSFIHSSIKRRHEWEELIAKGDAEVEQIPKQTSGLHLLFIVILFIGLMVSIYYMMQII